MSGCVIGIQEREHNYGVKVERPTPHPGPFRFIKADPEWFGIFIALGFVALGLLGLPIAKWFLLGVLLLGSLIALVFHFIHR